MTTIHEVAKAAGVSISTVSYALSGKRPISDSTRDRIRAAIRELGYEPNAGARMLAGERTHILALTEPLRADSHAPTHMAFVLASSVAARREGYDLLLLTDEEASAGMSRVAAADLVDAVLVLDVASDDPRVGIARAIDVPSVFIGVPDDHAGLHCVDLDFEAATRMALDALVEAGHREVAMIGQPRAAHEHSNFPVRVRRAFDAHAAERDLRTTYTTSGEIATDATKVRRYLAKRLDDGVRAFIVHGDDDLHLATLAVFAERDLTLGVDVSVVSLAASLDPARLPARIDSIPLVPSRSCDLAVELAMRVLDEPGTPPGVHLIAPEYQSAGSVGPPR